MEIKKIDVVSCGKIFGGILGIIGFILGIIFSLAVIMIAFSSDSMIQVFLILFSSLFVLLLIPVALGLYGFLAGIIMAYLYNTSAKRFGGLKINTKK
jgi:Ca2+/Na+ antiporter